MDENALPRFLGWTQAEVSIETENDRQMSGNTYKILSPAIAQLSQGKEQGLITIPKGAIITLLGPLGDYGFGDYGFVDIRWENKLAKMFVKDLQERAVLL